MIEKTPEKFESVEELLKKAKMLRKSENYEKAIEIYDSILKKEKDNIKALNGKGAVFLLQKEYAKASKIFEKVLTINPNFDKALYNKGLVLYKFKKYEDAVRFFNRAIKINQNYAKCFNAKGASLFKLGKYRDAIKAFEEAKKRGKEALPCVNAAEVYLLHEDLKSASEELEEAFNRDDKHTNGRLVEGRVKIEEKDYDGAIESFEKAARSNLDDLNPLLWDAYAKYLKAECSIDVDKECKEEIFSIIRQQEYKKEIFSIIRQLERANELCKKEGQKELKACILYFLGYFYYKSKDTFAAKEKLEECINLKSKSQMEQRAHELLDGIWNYTIKPPWWRWWLWSPLHRWSRRMIFLVLLIPLFLLLFQSIIPEWLAFIKADLTVSLMILSLSIFIILSPSISSIKAKEVEVELRSPPSFELFLTPSIMKERIEEHVNSEECATRVGLLWKKLSSFFNF